jgi:hypothetical protein
MALGEIVHTVSIEAWIEAALSEPDDEVSGIELYELTASPAGAIGIGLLEASCGLLDTVRGAVRSHGIKPGSLIPYLKFRLPETRDLPEWNSTFWGDIRGDNACVELNKRGEVFYWGVWESHHETVQLPIADFPQYTAIFRQHKGNYDGKPWKKFGNEIYVFAQPA